MKIIPREYQVYFWSLLFTAMLLCLWYCTVLLIESSIDIIHFPEILINPGTLTLSGFVSHILQLSAFFAAFRLLLPSKPIKHELGRPIFIINLDMMNESAPYGKCEVLDNFNEINNAPSSNGDRTLVAYKDRSGSIDVINELSSWGQEQQELVSVVYPSCGGETPPARWSSDWASQRRSFGCPTEEGNQFLSKPMKRGKLEALMWTLRERYEFKPEHEWGCRESKGYAMAYWNDERHTSCNLCEYFESKCENDFEKTKALWGISSASKTLNIVRLQNKTHEVINDAHIHIGGKGSRSGRVIKEVTNVENMDIVINTFGYSQLIAHTLPPDSSRFIIIETRGAPLKCSDIRVETKFLSKFGVGALRWIAVLSFTITLLVTAISYNQQTKPNNHINLDAAKNATSVM